MSQDKPVLSRRIQEIADTHHERGTDGYNLLVGQLRQFAADASNAGDPKAALSRQINEPPQALPGLDPITAKEPRAVPFEAGPASGSPDIDQLVGRLEMWAASTFNEAWRKDCREAAQALRALEADRERILAAHRVLMTEADTREETLHERIDALQSELAKVRKVLSDYEAAYPFGRLGEQARAILGSEQGNAGKVSTPDSDLR